MKGKLSIFKISLNGIITLLFGAVFIIALPLIAIFFVDVFISFISIFDPLHQGKNINSLWKAFPTIIVLQIIFGCLAGFISGVGISLLWQTKGDTNFYLYSVVIGFSIHFIFQVFSTLILALFYGEIVVFSWAITAFAIILIFSPLIGLLSAFICKKISRKI